MVSSSGSAYVVCVELRERKWVGMATGSKQLVHSDLPYLHTRMHTLQVSEVVCSYCLPPARGHDINRCAGIQWLHNRRKLFNKKEMLLDKPSFTYK